MLSCNYLCKVTLLLNLSSFVPNFVMYLLKNDVLEKRVKTVKNTDCQLLLVSAMMARVY